MCAIPIRPDVRALPEYRAGQSAPDLSGKVSSNENPYPPLPSVVERLGQAASFVNRYPDPASSRLIAALASRLGVSEDTLVVGTGSVALCQHLVSLVAGPNDEIVFGWPSFEAYPIVTGVAGATAVPVALNDRWEYDADAIVQHVTERTRCVFLCTPNNPTGTIMTHSDVLRVVTQVPSDVLVVIDEAYVEFVNDPAVARGLDVFREFPNVMLLRTFSKAYGLAGLRVGYAVADPSVARQLRKVTTPFGVSIMAEEAALASLEATEELTRRVEALIREREWMIDALRELGMGVAASQGNFVWITPEDVPAVHAALTRAGFVARAFGSTGLRITVTHRETNAAIVSCIHQAIRPAGNHSTV